MHCILISITGPGNVCPETGTCMRIEPKSAIIDSQFCTLREHEIRTDVLQFLLSQTTRLMLQARSRSELVTPKPCPAASGHMDASSNELSTSAHRSCQGLSFQISVASVCTYADWSESFNLSQTLGMSTTNMLQPGLFGMLRSIPSSTDHDSNSNCSEACCLTGVLHSSGLVMTQIPRFCKCFG